jgi:hypothetical protein
MLYDAAAPQSERFMLPVALVASLAIALTAPALAAQTGAEAVPATEAVAAAPKPKMICRNMPTLGSRLSAKRECATAEEWSRMQAEHRESLQKQQSLGLKGE